MIFVRQSKDQEVLDSRTGKFTVMIIYGQQNKQEKVEVWTPHEKRTFDPAGMDMLKALVAQWFVYVEGLGKKKN